MLKNTTKFIAGNLYHHIFPWDIDENYPYYDIEQKSWFKIANDEEKMDSIFVYLEKSFIEGSSEGWGIFLYDNTKLAIKLNDLCEYKKEE